MAISNITSVATANGESEWVPAGYEVDPSDISRVQSADVVPPWERVGWEEQRDNREYDEDKKEVKETSSDDRTTTEDDDTAWVVYTEHENRAWDFAAEGSGDQDRCHAYQLVEVEAYTQRPTFRFTGKSRSSHGARGGLFPGTQHTYTAYAPSCGLDTTSTSSVDGDRFRGEFKGTEILENFRNFNLPPVALKHIDPGDDIKLWEPKSDHEVIEGFDHTN